MGPWWERSGLKATADGLAVDGMSVAELAARDGTPLYIYSLRRVSENLARLRSALGRIGLPGRIYYALKANRFSPLLSAIRAERDVGIDACSPREVELALHAGFSPDEISVTACMLSNRDLDLLAAGGVHLNLDSLSALRRYAARVPSGTRIGLRVDPGVAAGYGGEPKLGYSNCKLGFRPEMMDEAVQTARDGGLVVNTLHIHCGWGLQVSDLPALNKALEMVRGHAQRIATLEVINVGGGLGVRHRETDEPLTPEAWAGAIGRVLDSEGLTIACEPGTVVVADAGLLVVEVNTVEHKGGITWIGVDAGHNINVYPYHYGIPLQVIHVGRPSAQATEVYTVAGNINEAGDILARNCPLPAVREGDLLALFPAGAYGSSMTSDHCLRGQFREVTV